MYRKLLDIGLILLLFVLSFVFFGTLLKPDESTLLIGNDLWWLFYPLTEFAFSALQAGRFPLWNPNLFLGFPQFAEPQLSTFYPVMWLFSSWPVAQTFVWLYAFHLGLTAAGGYVLVRQLGGRWSGALVGGLTLGFCSFMTAHIYAGHLPHIMTIAYLPWLLAAAHWAVKKRAWLPTVAATMVASVPLALAMLAGYAPFFPFLVGAVTLYMFWLAVLAWCDTSWRNAGRILLQWIGLGLFAGMLAAVQLLPTMQLAQLSSRVTRGDYAFASQFPMPIWRLLTLAVPDLFGFPSRFALLPNQAPYWARGTTDHNLWEAAIYVGVLPLVLWGMSWFLGKKRWLFWGVLGVASLILALGEEGTWHRILYQLIPGFGLFRVPARFGYFFGLSTAVLAGLMFDHWFGLTLDTFKIWQSWLTKLLMWSILGLGGLAMIGVFWLAGQTDPVVQLRVQGIVNQLVWLAFLLSLSLVLLIRGREHSRLFLVMAACVILVMDLWGYGSRALKTVDIDNYKAWAQVDEVLPKERDTYRVLSRGASMNLGLIYGFQHVAGYDDFRTETGMNLEELVRNDTRISQLLGVRFLIINPKVDISSLLESGWLKFAELSEVTIVELGGTLPKAFMVYDVIGVLDDAVSLRLLSNPDIDFRETAVVQIQPDTQCAIESGTEANYHIEITSYQSEEVVIQVDTDVVGWLVLADLDYPGWVARINNRSVPIQTTNYALRGVCVPAGSHKVVFSFEPSLFRLGNFISIASWGLLLTAVLVLAVKTRKNHPIM